MRSDARVVAGPKSRAAAYGLKDPLVALRADLDGDGAVALGHTLAAGHFKPATSIQAPLLTS